MLKVCINRQTGGDRRGGHYTHYAFTGLPGVDIAALADANPEAKDNFHLCGAKKLYASYEEMMETEKPDIVILCSRLPHEHYTEIKYALNHHCHVLCEKPLADDLPHAYELAELSRQTDCKVQMAHLARFAPTFQKMKQMISAGEIGRVLTCYMRGKEDTRGGGEDMLVLGTHLFDAACWIFGLPEMVYADVRVQNRPITNGINGIFESRRGLVPAVADPRMGITVCGTEGILTIRYTGDRSLRLCRNFPVPVEDHNRYETVQLPEPEEIPGVSPIDPKVWQINPDFFYQVYFAENNRRAAWDLMQAIKNRQEPLAGIDSAIHSLEMIIGIYQSAINHTPAALPLKDRRHPLC